ncbi:unnamed protein product [Phyllotreta striolata]|uniref:Uncharacterized protein n=1 Tax=Phyllotreta striolata TaxID=444603 RepID=A0A9N9XN02_PHYSR|nr:unnamed protein product [Phyllotreta striolata]
MALAGCDTTQEAIEIMAVVLTSLKNRVRTIKINRPKVKNAFNDQVYKAITKILNEDSDNNQVVVTILTGSGDYFTSGNDLKSSFETAGSQDNFRIVSDMIEALIDYPKLLISVVNGPAIGIGATLLTLCDIVYCSDTATFHTPFLGLGLCAEGASSYNFPFILGRSMASEMIFLGRKLTAREALQAGLVSRIVPQNELPQFIDELHELGNLSLENTRRNKRIIMRHFEEVLKKANKIEMDALRECADSEEFSQKVMNFLLKNKSKL